MGAIMLIIGIIAMLIKGHMQYKQKEEVMNRLNHGLENASYHYNIDGDRIDNATGRRFHYGTKINMYTDPETGQTKVGKSHCYKFIDGGGEIDMTELAIKNLLERARERGRQENKRFVWLNMLGSDLYNIRMRDDYFESDQFPTTLQYFGRDHRWLDMKTGAICITDYCRTKMIHWKTGEVLAEKGWEDENGWQAD